LSLSNFKVPLAKLSDNSGVIYSVESKGLMKNTSDNLERIKVSVLVSVAVFALPVVILITILLFKKRNYQLKMILVSYLLIFLQIAGTVILLLYAVRMPGTSVHFSAGLITPFLMIIFMFLGWKGVKHDEELIQSYNRMR
jgi:heme A synthase